MPVSSDTMRRLAALDMPAEALREVLSIIADMTAADENRRAKDRERKKSPTNSEENPRKIHGKRQEIPAEEPPQERPHTPKESPPFLRPLKGAQSAPPPGVDDPKSILAEVLPVEVAAEVVAHRKALKAPLTAGAARGLAKAFAVTGDASAAAQTMMTNGWRGFKAEWMTDARGARAGPAPQRRANNALDFFNRPDHDHASRDFSQDDPAPFAGVTIDG